jgi:hypothetical protein
MRFLIPLIVVLSILIAPLAAQAAGFCDSQGCLSFNIDKDASGKSQPDSKSAEAEHCCIHSHGMSAVSFPSTRNIELSALNKPLLKEAALLSPEPQALLRPPKAA